jgi:uncharacterized oligopeptide transporter (OPT) family protein
MTKKDSGQGFFDIDPAGKSPVQIELEWFHKNYRGDIPQLTVRAVLIGVALGGVMSLSNLYVGLKTGWGLGVAAAGAIIGIRLAWGMLLGGLLNYGFLPTPVGQRSKPTACTAGTSPTPD